MKHAAIVLSSVPLLLTYFLSGVVAAQSVPPRKGIPAIAKAANGVVVSIIASDEDVRLSFVPRHEPPIIGGGLVSISTVSKV